MAAAAIASGAVGPPEEGAGAGLLLDGTTTATGTGVGVVAVRPSCWASTAGSTVAEVASPCESCDFCAVDFVVPDEEVVVGWLVLLAWPLALVPVSAVLDLALGSLPFAALPESALDDAAGALLLALLFAAGELSARGGEAGGGAAWEEG